MKISGIYKIINKTNGKYYIGSSNDITGKFGRWYEHKWELKRNSHHNTYLQRSWNKYGEDKFNWIIVEKIPENQLLLIEQKYLDIAKTEKDKCYNLTFDATAPMRFMNEESKMKIRKKLSIRFSGKGNPMYGKTHTPEAIQKIFSHRKMNKLEKLVADELDKSNIQYTFQYFISDNGVCKSYDFKIKEKPLILEVDGDFWHVNPNTKNHYDKSDDINKNDKIKEDMALKRGIKIVRLWESDINKDPSIVGRTMTPYIYN
jgi:group I intron endonuclease